MKTKEELRIEVALCKEELRLSFENYKKARTKLDELERELAVCVSPFRIGQRVIEIYGRQKSEYEITSVSLEAGESVGFYGRKVLKSGGLHKNARRIYGLVTAKTDGGYE